MKSIIFYFTGSGNTLAIAKDLGKTIPNSELVRITQKNEGGMDVSHYDHIGFVFPVYFSGIPIMLRKFIANSKINCGAYVYAVANYGGKVDLGFRQIDKLLKVKGVNLNGCFGITMPGNYQILYDIDSPEKMAKNYAEKKAKVLEIAKIVLDMKEYGTTKVKFGTFVAGSLVYSIFKPNKMDKNFWIDEKCNSCGICKKICPAENISMKDNKPKWNHKCEQCLSCMHFCPKQSIQYRRGTKKRGRYKNPEVFVKELMTNG